MALKALFDDDDTENFQAVASEQGRDFERVVETLLKMSGWSIVDRHVIVAGVEVDIIAMDSNGKRWWIECKGSWRGKTPGSKRGDTVKKAVGVAAYLKHQQLVPPCPYMLVTSHMPNANSVGDLMLTEAIRQGWFDYVWCAVPDMGDRSDIA